MTVNKDLAFAVLDEIELNPENWNQRAWAMSDGYHALALAECGTSFCFAGHVVKHVYPDARFDFTMAVQRVSETDPDGGVLYYGASVVVLQDGSRYKIADLAAHLLGLDYDDADEIFYYGTVCDTEKFATLDGLRERVKRVLDEAGE